jgi:hypothetical protein
MFPALNRNFNIIVGALSMLQGMPKTNDSKNDVDFLKKLSYNDFNWKQCYQNTS